jgi:hypothetical protein
MRTPPLFSVSSARVISEIKKEILGLKQFMNRAINCRIHTDRPLPLEMYTYQHSICAPYFKTYTFLFFREYSLFLLLLLLFLILFFCPLAFWYTKDVGYSLKQSMTVEPDMKDVSI